MTDSEQIDLLEGVLACTSALVRSLPSPPPSGATPCAEFDVTGLVDHMCRWIRVFAVTANRRPLEVDPESFTLPDDPGTSFAEAAAAVVAGWRAHGLEAPVPSSSGGENPAELSFGITVLEYLTHGWDLARAIDTPIVFDDAATEFAHAAARRFLKPEYRAPGMFDDEVAVPADAPPIDRLMGFLGRDPAWSAS